MLPHQHFIVAIVPVLGYVIVRDRGLPTTTLLGVVFLGSQFPDLIDKPLGSHLGLIPTGRVFMHSLPTAFAVLVIIGLYGWKTDRVRLGAVFVFAHLSHLLADNYRAFLSSNPKIPSDLLWPFLPPIARPDTPGWAGPGEVYVYLWTAFSVTVLVASVVILVDTERHRIASSRAYVVRATHRLYRSSSTPR